MLNDPTITRNAIRSEADERAVADGCWYDPPNQKGYMNGGERVIHFFETFLKHSKGEFAGKPFILMDWQRDDLTMPLFSWMRANGTRRYRTAFITMAKKNGKSAYGSGLSLYMLVGDGEPGAEVYPCAADRDQARIVYNEAANMVDASPALRDMLDVRRSQSRINHPPSRSWMKALSAEVPTKEGLNWSMLPFDELHAQKTRLLWDTLRYGGAARRQPLLFVMTTAGYDQTSICFEQYEYAKAILSGEIVDHEYFALIYEMDKDADWHDEEQWAKANPSLGEIIDLDELRSSHTEATKSATVENTWRRYRGNQWTEQEVRWLPMTQWDLCAGDGPIDVDALKGRVTYGGLDLAGSIDLASFSLMFPPDDEDGMWNWLVWFWCPESMADDRERPNQLRYEAWAREGFMERTPGNTIDFATVREHIRWAADTFDLRKVAFDKWNALDTAQQLEASHNIKMVAFGQTIPNFNEPCKRLEKLLMDGKICHGGHPVLRWCATNVSVYTSCNDDIRPIKPEHSSTKKIDGIVSGLQALGVAITDDGAGWSSYNDMDEAKIMFI